MVTKMIILIMIDLIAVAMVMFLIWFHSLIENILVNNKRP